MSDMLASYLGIALGLALAFTFIKWVKLHHVLLAILYLAGAAVFALGAYFLAWPLMDHFQLVHYAVVPMLIGVLFWSVLTFRVSR
ncbi:MAG: hypothetical protein M0Z48_00640 [Nitrospiraceae bacterium]|nr:hypothetical protein [Nitrospiraceae bacterium]